MTNPQTDELEPCPLCAGEAAYSERECLNSEEALQYFEFISCDDCQCCVSSEYHDDIYVVWNTRPAEQALKAEIQRLNKWAGEFSNRQIEERRTGELYQNELKARIAELEAAQDDYISEVVSQARNAAAKASSKFPQPNYVLLKVAEEAGEVVRAGVHYAEGRLEWPELECEVVQTIAMLFRLLTEGDEINGVIPPTPVTE